MISSDFICLACCFQCNDNYKLVSTGRIHVYEFSSICIAKLHAAKFLMIAEQACVNSSNNLWCTLSFGVQAELLIQSSISSIDLTYPVLALRGYVIATILYINS